MYAALWRVLPGPVWVRLLIVLIALAVIVSALFYVVFPWVSHLITPTDSTIGG